VNAPTVSYSGADYQAGDTICGRWQVRSICGGRGRSGMGVVYVVDDRLRGEVLAVKTLQPQFVGNHRIRELLRREANAWLGMGRHPNIVALNFVEALGTQIYLFMDYIAPDEHGRNCLTHFLAGNPLPHTLAAKWSIDTCLALAFMREHGIEVHRDIKPDNLMIDSERDVRVTDFGLARAFAGVTDWTVGEALPNVTAVGSFVGTPGYIAPEVVGGDAPSVASDIYAFGLVMVQMLTGKQWAPFTGEWRGDVEAFERTTMKVRESLHQPIVGTPFDEIVGRCLEYDPAKRWTDFREIARALADACARSGVEVGATKQTAPAGPRTPDADHVTALYNLGRLQEALDAVRKLRQADPHDAHLLTCEGVIRGDLGDMAAAIPLLEEACARSQGSCSNWNNLGRALRRAGRSAAALDAFQRAIDCDDAHANIWASKGNSLSDLGRYEEALAAYDRAVSLDRFHWAAQLGRAQALEKLERWVDALVAAESVLDVEPEDAEALALHAACVRRLLATQSGYSDVYEFMGRCSQNGAFEDGLRAVRDARFRSGATSELWNNEAVFLKILGDNRAALRCLERALRMRPEYIGAWVNKGRVLRGLGQLQDALPCFERAATLSPQDPVLWLDKYACHVELGLGLDARASFRGACERAQSAEHRALVRQSDVNLYYLTMADIAYAAKDYTEAHRCAASVAAESPLHVEAAEVLARARYQLAVQFAQKDCAADATGFAAVVRVMQSAADGLGAQERGVVSKELDVTLQHYVTAAESRNFAALPSQTPLRNLALLVARHCTSEWALTWARYRLFESLAREAVTLKDEAAAIWVSLDKQRRGVT
jgi:tetratricopeptide (TPR) repeat protein